MATTTWEPLFQTDNTATSPNGVPRPGIAVRYEVLRARAYCGAAHGLSWTLDPDSDPPDVVDLPLEGGLESYRLVYNPLTGRQARDHHGNYVYVPVRARART